MLNRRFDITIRQFSPNREFTKEVSVPGAQTDGVSGGTLVHPEEPGKTYAYQSFPYRIHDLRIWDQFVLIRSYDEIEEVDLKL